MGTNYYTREKECGHCGRHEEVHLGKSSAGWQFSFQYNGGEYYKSVPEMKTWLEGKKIWDEYGREVTHEEFWGLVDMKQSDPSNKNHAEQVQKDYGAREYELIIGGYSFTNCQFS